jgi:hypothetical protein
MRTYLTWATLSFALVAGASAANAQSLVTSPSEVFVVQPSGTLIGPVPLVAVSAGVLQPVQTVQTIQTVQVVRPAYAGKSWQVIARPSTASPQSALRDRSIITCRRRRRCKGLLRRLSSRKFLRPCQGKCSISLANFSA